MILARVTILTPHSGLNLVLARLFRFEDVWSLLHVLSLCVAAVRLCSSHALNTKDLTLVAQLRGNSGPRSGRRRAQVR